MMRQIIPFSKELLFKTKISQITSISLEHTLNYGDDMVSGDFLVCGDYKMTEASINREKFSYNIPFEISLENKYKKDSIKIDIDNFYYEVVNDDTLKVNIDVYIDGEEMGEESNDSDIDVAVEAHKLDLIDLDVMEEGDSDILDRENDINVDIKEDNDIISNMEKNIILDKEKNNNIINDSNDDKVDNNINIDSEISIMNSDSFNQETYVTYYVYLVKEGDTLDKIIDKFSTNKESIEDYNDITNIKVGDKLIIPSSDE